MGVKRFEDLVCWQLSRELKKRVYVLSNRPGCKQEWKFRTQLREAAAGPPAHISEGFGRRNPREFAHFLSYARSSLDETKNHLIDGVDRGHWTEDDLKDLWVLLTRAISAVDGLQTYLNNCDPNLGRT